MTAADDRPFLFVTTEIPPDRVGAFRALAELVPIEFALFGGGLHATAGVTDHGLAAREVAQRDVFGLAASGRYRGVVAGTAGRTALPAAWLGAERARIPFVLWTALWAHPRSLAHLPGDALLRVLYRRAAVVVTYGSHVSAFAERRGADQAVIAPQAVDQAFWGALSAEPRGVAAETRASGPARILFVGRDAPGKGLPWLLASWGVSGLAPTGRGELRLIGPDRGRAHGHPGVVGLGFLSPREVRAEMQNASAVVIPSERTGTFREPWGLVVNEAMHVGALVIASDEVGAVAGGLAEDGRTALVVPAGDRNALGDALRRAVTPNSPELRVIRTVAHARAGAYSQEAWASAFASALRRSVAWAA